MQQRTQIGTNRTGKLQSPMIEAHTKSDAGTPPDRSANERHLQRANAKPEQLTRENENAHDLFGYKKSTQENPCAINIDTL